MAYGFNDDKSKFDLSGIDTSRVGTFTPNANKISNSNVQVWADGTIGHIAGYVTLVSRATTNGVVGHIDGITPDARGDYTAGLGQCGHVGTVGQMNMSVQANGDLFYTRETNDTTHIGLSMYFNFDFTVYDE